MAQSRRWCFTLNNPTSNELPAFEKLRAAVWQREKGTTPHLQGYVELTTNVKLGGMKKWLPTAHFEIARGSAEDNERYCTKDDTREAGPWRIGELNKTGSGARTDITAVKDAILNGASKRQVFEDYPEILAKYPRFVETALRYATEDARARVTDFEAKYNWQQGVLDMLAEEPNSRQLLWVYDPYGNAGKTYLSRHLVDNCGAFYCNGGKSVDITHAYNGERIVVFDYVRDAKDYVGYGVIEQMKNGIMFSPKYESGMKAFDPPHVIIFANFAPEDGKFSADRVAMITLDSQHRIVEMTQGGVAI